MSAVDLLTDEELNKKLAEAFEDGYREGESDGYAKGWDAGFAEGKTK